MRLRDTVKYFCFVLFTIICLAQCYAIIENYLQYHRTITIGEIPIRLLKTLPGITICNNNRLSLKKIIKTNSTIKRYMENRFPDYVRSNTDQQGRFTKFRNGVAQIFQSLNYNPQTQLDSVTMDQLYHLKPENTPFIKWVGCARTWSDTLECDKLTPVDSIQDRRCITFLHNGALYYDFVNKPTLFNSEEPASEFGGYFESKEVIKFVIDFQPEDYADLKRQIGARLIFHENKYVGSSSEPDYFITRGYRYTFSIDRVDSLLSRPYDNCLDYTQIYLNKFSDKIDPRVPLHTESCFQNCVVKNLINIHGCFPPTMPYFRNDSFDPDLNIKSCKWASRNVPLFKEYAKKENSNDSYVEIMRNYMKIRRHCLVKCILSCRNSRFITTSTKTVWPSDVQLLFDETGTQKKLRHCCAVVVIKYRHHHYKIQQYKLKYNAEEIIGDLGGLLAVWLGLSIVSIYHAIQKLIDFCGSWAQVDQHYTR